MGSGKGEHNCVLCNAKLETKEALQEHFRKHANKEIDARGRTIKTVNKNKTSDALCDICGHTFESVTATIRHRFRMHPNSPSKFYCPFCGKQFPLKTHRDSHQSSHKSSEGIENEHKKCESCNVTFFNEKAFDFHHRSVHKRIVHMFKPIATPPPSNKIKVNSMNDALSVYYCHLCGVEYVVKFNLQQHLERAHSKEEREAIPQDLMKCTMCCALFCNKKAYEVHNSYHQPDDLYVTSEEQRLQTVTKVDQDFDIRRVETLADKYVPKTRVINKRPVSKWSNPTKDVSKECNNDFSSSDEEEDNKESSESESDIPFKKRIASS